MIELLPAEGPGLASTAAMDPLRQPFWTRRMRNIWACAHGLVSAMFALGLWVAGYPWQRTVAVAALLTWHVGMNLRFSALGLPVRMMKETPSRCPGNSAMLGLVALLTHFLIVALSGGLRSPFLVVTLAPLSAILITTGWSRPSKLAVGLVLACATLLLILPHAVFGPVVSEPWFSRLVGVTLFSVTFLHSTYLVAMTRALHESHSLADRARERMTKQALARARELEQLSAQLSHELKNPLGAIKALVQLSRRNACDEKSRERLQVAESEVERMSVILQEYLSFSRPMDKLRRETLSLAALADEVVELLSAQAVTNGVLLQRQGDARVEADPRRLREALFNLTANALEATPRGGSVEIGIVERESRVHLEVRDSGRGMPQDVLDRLGTPFFTTREQGTGLGVAMARSAFAQHGGSLDYQSEPGRGTVATGILPREGTHGAAAPR